MRLIDADALINLLESDYGVNRVLEVGMVRVIEDSPTAFDVDEVVGQLKTQANLNYKRADEHAESPKKIEMWKNYRSKAYSYEGAIDIVKAGGITR